MNIVVNGRPREVASAITVAGLVDDLVDDRRGVAVAVDGDVVPRAAWEATGLHEGARVEIVAAVQGG